MPSFRNCQIGVKIDGLVLEEYGTQIDETEGAVTTWIACESEKDFEIFFRAQDHPCSLQFVIFVDGVELVNRGYDQRKMGREVTCSGVSIDASNVKPFVFSDLVFPDQEVDFDHYGMGDVGTIRVEVLQVVFSESREPTYIVPGLSNDPLHKRSKISGARGICLGEQRMLRTKKMTSMPFDPMNPGPIATFTFIYRPRSMLLAQGIIPTYVPKFEDVEMPMEHVDDSKEEKIRRLRAQQEEIQRELKELEEIRRLRDRQAEIQRELDDLEGFGFPEQSFASVTTHDEGVAV